MLKQAILGLAVGDALGVPFEFTTRKEMELYPATDMVGFKAHNQQPGIWSDDTSMTLCLLDSLSKGYDINDIAKNFVDWFTLNKFTPHGQFFDIGSTTYQALMKLKNGISPLESGMKSEVENGNGSLMRTLPLAFYLKRFRNYEKKFNIIKEVSAITHAHSISQFCCCYYVEFAIQLLKNKSLSAARKTTNEKISQYLKCPNEVKRILNRDYTATDDTDIFSSGYVVYTLDAAFWCLFNSTSYQECVLKAVNLGNDTDTIAAIVGGLAGIYFKDIPQNWIDALQDKEQILSICDAFEKNIN